MRHGVRVAPWTFYFYFSRVSMIMVKEITRGVTMSWYGAARKTDLGPTLWGKILNLLFVCDRLWLNENVFETIFKRISVFRSLRLLWSMLLIVWIERVDKRLERGHRWCMDTFCFLVFTCYYYLIVETVVETRLETVLVHFRLCWVKWEYKSLVR